MLNSLSIRSPNLNDSLIIKGLICQATFQKKPMTNSVTIKQVDDCWKEIIKVPKVHPVFVANNKGKFAGAALCSLLPVMHYGRNVCQINDIVISKFSDFNQINQYLLKYIDEYSKKQNAFVVNISQPFLPLSYSSVQKIPINIKNCSLSHINDLKYISELTFRETFGSQNTEEDMKKYYENTFNDNVLSHEI